MDEFENISLHFRPGRNTDVNKEDKLTSYIKSFYILTYWHVTKNVEIISMSLRFLHKH